MAQFEEIPINSADSGAQVWQRIQSALLEGKSVEVLRPASPGEGDIPLRMRVWFGTRADGSNRWNADDEREY